MSTAVENQGATFTITGAKRYVLFVTLSTQDNTKLLQQLKSDLKRTISWNKYQSKVSHYIYLKNCFNMVAIDLSKQQELDADPKANQQISVTGNLDCFLNSFFLLLKKQKKLFWIFHKEL